MSKKVSRKNIEKVMERLVEMAEKSAEDSKVICMALNVMLDELLEQDFFGTEGQLDPRGDHRND